MHATGGQLPFAIADLVFLPIGRLMTLALGAIRTSISPTDLARPERRLASF